MKLLSLFLILFSIPSYGSAVCSGKDAAKEALDRWGGDEVIDTYFDPDKKGYFVTVIDPRSSPRWRREKIRFILHDRQPCEERTEELERQATEFRKKARLAYQDASYYRSRAKDYKGWEKVFSGAPERQNLAARQAERSAKKYESTAKKLEQQAAELSQRLQGSN